VIKGAGQTGDGQPLLLLGLSEENMARLVAGEPILIRAEELVALGVPAMQVVICYGKTEAAILKDLRATILKDLRKLLGTESSDSGA
jgi:hypothetical protein